MFVLALVLRLGLAVGVAISQHGGGLLTDDGSYARMAAQVANGGDAQWGYYEHWLYGRTGALLWPITALFRIFGPVTLVGQAYVALLGAATAALTTAVALGFLPRRHALIAGAIVAFLPSQILWSSLILKDAAVWMGMSGLALVMVRSSRVADQRKCLAIGLALLLVLAFSRRQTLEIAVIALVISAAFTPREVRARVLAVTAAVALLLPMAFGMGPFGVTFVTHSGSLQERREKNAIGAASAVVPAAPVTPTVTPTPSTPGPPPASDTEIGGRAAFSYMPKGLAVVLLRPFPWDAARSGTSATLRLAAVESLIWYPLLLLAAIGLVAARSRLRFLAFPLLALAGTALMYALTEGSLGTAFRHRGELVWPIALLAALGASTLLGRRARGAAPEDELSWDARNGDSGALGEGQARPGALTH